MRTIALLGTALLAGCTALGVGPATVDRMYVIECGENHVKDLSRWTPGVNVGKAHVFGDYCYLIKHAKGWMLWDSGNADRLAEMPNGLSSPALGGITAYMRKPLAGSLKEIGIEPKDVRYFAMSHSHGDHTGNANLFASSVLLMQSAEYGAVFGPDGQKFGMPAANVERLRNVQVEKLNGDYDVFGDGSVVIKSTPGHTPGHQSLFVRLPRRGPVLLTGDMVHLTYSWEKGIVPGFNYDQAASRGSMEAMRQFAAQTGAEVWINHDKAQHELIRKAPQPIE